LSGLSGADAPQVIVILLAVIVPKEALGAEHKVTVEPKTAEAVLTFTQFTATTLA
jgi:hypothetical protein